MRNKQLGYGPPAIAAMIVILVLIGALAYVGYNNFVINKVANTGDSETGYPSSKDKPFPPLVTGVGYVPEGLSDQEGAEYLGKYATIPGLSDALEKIAKQNPCAVTEGRFKQIVLGVTKDETQALIGNGCGSAGFLRSFMVKQGNAWTRVGSSNGRFDDSKGDTKNFTLLLDTPSCDIVEKYKIQTILAPVCYTEKGGNSSLVVGDSGNYSYKLR